MQGLAREVWYRLVQSSNGHPHEGTTEDFVLLEPNASIAQFTHAVHAANSEVLDRIARTQLRVYENATSFDNRSAGGGTVERLNPTTRLGSLGSEQNILLVAVPERPVIQAPAIFVDTTAMISFSFGEIDPITPGTLPPIEDLCHPFCFEYVEDEEVEFAYENVPANIPEETSGNGERTLRRPVITLPYRFLHDAGIYNTSGKHDVVLFIRDRCLWEIKFITHDVIEKGNVGYIQGHPGTGKSITALITATALCRDEKWNVLWIHAKYQSSGELFQLRCLRLRPDNTIGKLTLPWTDCDRLVESFKVDGKMLLIIDGVNRGSVIWQNLVRPGLAWFDADQEKRRVIFLSSQGFDTDIKDQDEGQIPSRFFRHGVDLIGVSGLV